MSFFDTSLEFLKGVGPQRAALLQKELKLFTFGDLIQHYPFRYEDRTRFYRISEVNELMPFVQMKGKISDVELIGDKFKRRLVAYLSDDKGELELVWFQGINWAMQKLKPNVDYVVFGKPSRYGSKLSIAHPEIELLTEKNEKGGYLQPVYPLSEKLRNRYIDNKFIIKLQQDVIKGAISHIRETLPAAILQQHSFISKKEALINIHFPKSLEWLERAQRRLKFEELFFIQLRLIKMKLVREEKFKGIVFGDTSILTRFYKEHLPFDLTEAQKKVVREIYSDMKSGKQMNRLLQGDVGSGKTIVGFISILLAIGGDAQAALMAPTEILAQQHYANLKKYADKMNISIALLTGSVKKSARKPIHEQLADGSLKILIGTHALLEEEVKFNKLGLAIIDEQHRFGVAQRSKLWQKNSNFYPHVLVMTATPIPRTLAMTLYGDLEISVIDELPKGRKPIKTTHQFDSHRLQVNGFIKTQIEVGRQVYVVYPLIEESEKLDLKHLMDGYESISRAFPEIPISILHGQMKPEAKDFEMARFAKGETKIMVATTVIEVGVDVPNASVMIVESAQRFGLSQLHQLRGRVGRGAEQSFCILMTDHKLSSESKTRIETMVRTNNGFEIAETDLKLRGPGDLMGTQQSGALDLLIADLGKDGELLKTARVAAQTILASDPLLQQAENRMILQQIESIKKSAVNWSRIS
ncbi:MAG: ATP-dependent DNA helicase RecG [Cytophagales bacterium]|jgi:ATP-dependent DNA helicase RecG|nr:ATP-dependent DNA helicase RecG [Cytophagales bacterium]MCA6386598.1 ATP-dependent DNA helicase RecG [Cytophagales bacterium]MCA6389892.1 ATP-dependent DNA helicase RecG [Cytophagales bacterium]MCA6395198.1 ATP-dependent DNA helicase RecG [Cytophagales bacterium]MCA6398646.1 ATP-dependent DNA helicase RecG [Cytophagales bacterium]